MSSNLADLHPDVLADLPPSTDILWSRMAIGRSAGKSTPQMHHGIYIMGCIWQPFWILQEKVEFPVISE